MQDKTWTFVDKSTWGDGPWQGEPDKAQWIDKATGLPCLVVRHPDMGHWCAYVGVSQGHPNFEKEYDDVGADVHGGLTYADHCRGGEHGVCHIVEPGEDDHVWWLGFDFAHSGDKSPGADAKLRVLGMGVFARQISDAFDGIKFEDHYWTFPEVQAECAALAEQLL